jgi:hypothetical protein
MQQSVVVTFLPQDRHKSGQAWRASLFVSPRLTPDGPNAKAADFPAFANWPKIGREAKVHVERRGGQTITVDAADTTTDAELWERYLAPQPVRGWEYEDLSSTDIRSFPAQSILALVQGLYTAVATASGGGHPDPLAGGLRDLGAVYTKIVPGTSHNLAMIPEGLQGAIFADDVLAERAIERSRRALGKRPMEPGGMAPNVTALTPAAALADAYSAALDLAEARRFYDRLEARDPDEAKYPLPDPTFAPAKLDKPDPDFHDVLGALSDHPELLEALGIIVRVRLPDAFVGQGGDFRAWLEHPALAGNTITEQAWTRTVVDGRYFQAVSETGDIENGQLLLSDPNRFDVAQTDVDSTALLVEQRVANVYAIADAVSGDEPVSGDLPALRSSGFTVTRLARSELLVDRIQRSKSNADLLAAGQGNEVVLFAEDLTRGYRVDVHDGGAWRSLMRRSVRIVDRDTRKQRLAVADQEAYIKASALGKVPNANVDRQYLHEAVFGWDGWSLAVRRPGKHMPTDPSQADVVTDDDDKFPGNLELEVEVGLLKGTLPRLRYGSQYRFRARSVDLAGHSTDFPRAAPSTTRRPFRRFQPISHPVTVPRHGFTEGESVHRLVVRTGVKADNLDVTKPLTTIDLAAYAATLAAATPRQYSGFRADSQRHLAPPKTSQLEAELHGQFDDAIGVTGPGSIPAYRAAFARARREEGTLADRVILDATNPQGSKPVAGIALVPPLARDGEFTPQQLKAMLENLKRGEAPEAGFAIIHDTNSLAVPYLPDPLAFGIALRFTGGGTASGWSHTQLVQYSGSWPDLETYRLVLQGGNTPAVSVAGRVITVRLPPGGTATVRGSSRLADTATLDRLGIWEWIVGTVPAGSVQDVADGGHQMVTPGEDLALVHATQRPLVRPAFDDEFAAERSYGDTFARFRGILRSQAATTGRLDVEGRWAEWVDDPAIGPPELIAGRSGHAFDLVLPDGLDDLDLAAGTPSDLKDEFGDHKHRMVAYSAIATTRFREYLPEAETANAANLQVTGPATTIHVPNSIRPPVPVVHSIIPTFEWREEDGDPLDPVARRRSRRGGLRVWLERPWYPSGEGEMLGVVLSGADAIIADTDLRRQFVSLWGKDPIRLNGALPAAMPRPRDFSGDGLMQMDRLTIGETGSGHPGVSVVGHPVRYATARDMWYADLRVDPGEAFWPFLRLALARFQPWSVPNAHLSKVVVADFVQLLNDRTAAIARPADDLVRVTVTGIEERRPTGGVFPSAGGPGPGGALVNDELLAEAMLFAATASTARPRGVRAWIERRGPTPSDLDWDRVGDIVALARIDEDEVMRVWSGDVPLSEPLPIRQPGLDQDGVGSDWRLVLEEWESLPLDVRSGPSKPVERTVYMDRFPL